LVLFFFYEMAEIPSTAFLVRKNGKRS
jgi:hypothetical protein